LKTGVTTDVSQAGGKTPSLKSSVNKKDRLLHKVCLRLNNRHGDILSGPGADLHFIVLRALRTEAGVKVTDVKLVVG